MTLATFNKLFGLSSPVYRTLRYLSPPSGSWVKEPGSRQGIFMPQRVDQLSDALRRVETLLAVRAPDLKPRELTICALIYENVNSKEMAEWLGLSERTIENHRYRLRRRFGLAEGEHLRPYILRMAGSETK